eukprot:m.197871 g.197871  ORF g.197871 m.197871 type:complete len:1004 (-) comp17030_c0_seq2:1444-4455(-)
MSNQGSKDSSKRRAATNHAVVNLQRQHLPSFVHLAARLRDVVALNVSGCGLQSLDGIEQFVHLELLVASANDIKTLAPLDRLHQSCHHLELLYLDNNCISDISELGWLAGLTSLKHLKLRSVKTQLHRLSRYRDTCFTICPSLRTLDGLDQQQCSKAPSLPAALLAEPSDIAMEYGYEHEINDDNISDSGSYSSLSSYRSRQGIKTPHIDEVLQRYRKKRAPHPQQQQVQSSHATIDNLDRLEQQLNSLLTNSTTPRYSLQGQSLAPQPYVGPDHATPAHTASPTRASRIPKPIRDQDHCDPSSQHEVPYDDRDSSHASAPAQSVAASWDTWVSTVASRPQPGLSREQTLRSEPRVDSEPDTLRSAVQPQTQSSEGHMSGNDYPVRPVEQLLGQELSSERHRRQQAEHSAQVLLARMQEEQERANDGLSRYEQCLDTIQQLERALKSAGQRIDDLTETKAQLHANNNQVRLEMERVKQQHEQAQNHLNLEREQHQKDIDQIMSLKESLQSLRLMQVERVKTLEIELAGAAQEVESANRTSRASRKQVSKLQELLATKESEYRTDKENMVHIHGPEVQMQLERLRQDAKEELRRQQDQHREDLLAERARYQDLEQEFRTGLHAEASRYRELQTAFENSNASNIELVHEMSALKAKATEAAEVTKRLTALIKDQQHQLAEQLATIEGLQKDSEGATSAQQQSQAAIEAERLKVADLDRQLADHQATIVAQESIINGLREERKLWSQELAHQGASLAASRGKIEAENEAFKRELETARHEAKRAEDAVKIKAKLVDDNTASIRSLRQSLADKERELHHLKEEYQRREGDLKDRLQAEKEISQQMQADLEACHERKSKLKSTVSDLTHEAEALRRENEQLRLNWQNTGDTLGQLEMQVEEMRKITQDKEQKWADENSALKSELRTATQVQEQTISELQGRLATSAAQQQELVTALEAQQSELTQSKLALATQEGQIKAMEQAHAERRAASERKMQRLQKVLAEMQDD